MSPWCSASSRRATRPASASSAAGPCSPTRWPARWTCTSASAASCRRSPAAPTSPRSSRPSERAAATADVDLADLDAIAVTAGPGLMGALVVGLASAKALSAYLNKPLYGVNHLVGHVAVDLLDHGPLPMPSLALLVSGGHTELLVVNDIATDIVRGGLHHRRRRGRGLRQGGPRARPALPGRAGDRQGGAGRRPDGDPLPARPDRPPRPGEAPLRLLVLRPQDRRRPVGRAAADRRGSGAGRGCRGQLPGGRLRRADGQDGRRRPAPGRQLHPDRRGGVAANSRLPHAAGGARGGRRDRAAAPAPGAVHRQRRDDRRRRQRGHPRRGLSLGTGFSAHSGLPVSTIVV